LKEIKMVMEALFGIVYDMRNIE